MAKDLDAIFQRTSAKESTGVEELFIKIGKKILNPAFIDNDENIFQEVERKKRKSVKLDSDQIKQNNNNNNDKENKGCC